MHVSLLIRNLKMEQIIHYKTLPRVLMQEKTLMLAQCLIIWETKESQVEESTSERMNIANSTMFPL
jgi:hypothetical protein